MPRITILSVLTAAFLSTVSLPASAALKGVAGATATIVVEHGDELTEFFTDVYRNLVGDKDEKEKAGETAKLIIDQVKDGEGLLLRVNIYKNANDALQIGDGGLPQFVGTGKTLDDVAQSYYRQPKQDFILPMPDKMQRDPEDSFLVWAYRKDGKLVIEKTSFPGSEEIFDRAKEIVGQEIEAKKRADEKRAAELAASGVANMRQMEADRAAQEKARADFEATQKASSEKAAAAIAAQQAESVRRTKEMNADMQRRAQQASDAQKAQLSGQIINQAVQNSMHGPMPTGGGGIIAPMAPPAPMMSSPGLLRH